MVMTDEEYARYSPWQQRLQNQHAQPPPPGVGYVWQPYAMGGGQWVIPASVRLSDEDVARIAAAVVRSLRASGALQEPVGTGYPR